MEKGKTTKPALPAHRYLKYAIGQIIPKKMLNSKMTGYS
jgi:hypothetical protein